jgi:hypothetical protein
VNRLTVLKLALGATGVVVFGYGLRVDSQELRWIGIGFVAVAALLRFMRRP